MIKKSHKHAPFLPKRTKIRSIKVRDLILVSESISDGEDASLNYLARENTLVVY